MIENALIQPVGCIHAIFSFINSYLQSPVRLCADPEILRFVTSHYIDIMRQKMIILHSLSHDHVAPLF